MKNYRDATPERSCGNCKHCFVYQEFEEWSQYFCTHGSDKRPPCDSVQMGELDNLSMGGERWDDACEVWDVWADEHKVKENGVCDCFEKEEVTGDK